MSLKRPFFIIIIFLILFISSFVFYINKALLYSPETTHYNLTKEIIKFYNLNYDPDLTSRQTELILRGSIDEDTLPRPAFHLYDPIYNRAPFGVYTAKQWALDSSIQSSAIQKFASLLFNIFGQGKFEYHGDYSWLASINYFVKNDSDKAYYGLGHILHLTEDMTVPAHTRNDPHPPLIDNEPYENWAHDNNETINFNLAGPLFNRRHRPANFYTIGEYFDNLARYSNKYFFSKDSVPPKDLSKDYITPIIIKEQEEDLRYYLQRTYAWGEDENGNLFRLAEVRMLWLKNEKSYLIDKTDQKLNTDYWSRLAPKAVQYGAGVIKLFIDEAEYQVQLAKKQPELNWWQKAQIFIQDLFGIGGEEKVQEPVTTPVTPSESLPQPKPTRFPNGGPAILPQPPTTPAAEIYLVQRVIDGDTILLENGQIVRYIGINAPELPNGCFSQQASEKNKELVEGKKVLLEKDVSEKDKYGRILRYVYFDSIFINKYLIANGYAYDLVIAPDIKYSQELVQAEETAKKLKKGIWGEACHPIKEGEVKGESIEKEQGEDEGGAVVVTGPKTGGGGGASRPDTQEPTQPPTPTEPPTTEPEDTSPPDVLIKSLTYNYASSSLFIEWSSSEIPSVSFDVDYKIGGGDWNNLLTSASEVQIEIIASIQDTNYYFRIRAKDLAGNESDWQEKSIEILSKPLVINEIAWMGTEAQANDEWIELYNRADYEIDLNDWILEAIDGTPSINLIGVISSRSYFLLERTTDETVSNISADQIYSGGLENEGEDLSLKNNTGNIIDQVDCDTNWYAGENKQEAGKWVRKTMERVNPAVAGTDSKNWQTYIGSGSGAVDADGNPILGTPKAQNSVYDANPPTKITDLAVSDSLGTFLILQWTAPSDEKSSLSLTYDIRYASESISEENWASLSQIADIPLVESPGALQLASISGLKYDTTYYFAIKTSDGLNISKLSNILVYSTGSPPTLANSPWPVFQRDVAHTGLSPYQGSDFISSSSVNIKWTADLGAPVYASPVIGLDGTIYVGDIMGKFYAINPINGQIKWVYDTYNYELGKGGIYFSAAVASDGTIYFSAFGSYLYALTPNGKLKWKYQIGGSNTTGSSPVIGSDGTIYLTGANSILFAINPDGTLKWSYYISDIFSLSASALGSDGTIYISSSGSFSTGYLYAFDIDGNLKWMSENINPMTGQALSLDSNDIIYNSSATGGSLRAINPTDGSIIWFYRTWRDIFSSSAIGPTGNIYVINQAGMLYALNSGGNFIWVFGAGGLVQNSPVVDSNEVIYFGSEDKNIYAINLDGSLKWNYELSDSIYSSPIIGSDGTIYIATADGKFYAIGE